jgi:hypothetical protein
MIPAAKHISKPTISLLLVLCLLPVITVYEPIGVHNLEKTPKTALFTAAIMWRAAAATVDNRTNFKSSDGLFKDALTLGQTSIDLARASVSFLTEFRDRFAQCSEQTAISIRAPPFINL